MARNGLKQPDVPGKDGDAAPSSGTRGETAQGTRNHVSQGPRETPVVPHQLWMEGLKYCSFRRVKSGSILSYSIISEVGQTPQKHSTKFMKPCLLFMALLLAWAEAGREAGRGGGWTLWLRCVGPCRTQRHTGIPSTPSTGPSPASQGPRAGAGSSGTG